MAALGSLVVSLTAQTAQFTQAMDRAAYQSQKNFSAMTNAAKAAGAAIGLAFSGAALIRSIKNQIDLADQLEKTSQKVGVQAQELQKLQYAADLSGVASDTLIRALSRVATEAANGSDTLKNLGVAVTDQNGKLRASDAIFRDIAERISKMEDGTQKAALVTKIFGDRIGRDLVPLLNQGEAGLKKLAEEAESLGFILDDNTRAAAERFNDNLTRMGRIKDGLFAKIARDLLPALEDLTEVFIKIAKEGSIVEIISKAILVVFQTVTVVGSNVAFVLVQVGQALVALNNSARALLSGDFAGSLNVWKQYNLQAKEAREKLDEFQKSIMGLGATARDGVDPVNRAGQSTENLGNSTDKVSDAIDKLRREYQALFLTKQEMMVLDLKMMGATKQQIADATALMQAAQKERDLREKAKKVTDDAIDLYQEYKKLYDETASPVQKLADEEARLLRLRERLIKAGYDTVTVENLIAEARMNAADKFLPPKPKVDETKDAIEDLSKAISTSFEDALINGKGFRELLKGIEQDILRIITRRLVTAPLEKFLVNLDFSSIFGGLKFAGGPVNSGKAYIVGENGPEIFMPPVSGNIVPNGQTAGMVSGSNVTVSNTFYLAAPADKRTQQQVAAMAGMSVQRAIARNT
jgi:hypothetical protein